MPSVAELAPHVNFQENVGKGGVCSSRIRVSLLKLTAELRPSTGSMERMMAPCWTATAPKSSFPDWNGPREMKWVLSLRTVEGNSTDIRADGHDWNLPRSMISLSILAIRMISLEVCSYGGP